MIRARHASIAVVMAVALSACSGDEASSPTTPSLATSVATTATTALPVATTPPAAPTVPNPAVAADPVFRSLQGFLAAFTAVASTGATDGNSFVLDEDAVTTGPVAPSDTLTPEALGGATTGFITVTALPSAALGGTMRDDTAVTSVFVLVDPQQPAAAAIVLSLLASTIASRAEFDQGGFATAYRELASEAADRVGEQIWFPSTNGSGDSLVATVVEGGDGNNDLIEVAIVPVGEESAATAAVKPIRNAVFALVA